MAATRVVINIKDSSGEPAEAEVAFYPAYPPHVEGGALVLPAPATVMTSRCHFSKLRLSPGFYVVVVFSLVKGAQSFDIEVPSEADPDAEHNFSDLLRP